MSRTPTDGNKIYIWLVNQCLSSLKLWVSGYHLWQVSCFIRVLWFPPLIKQTATTSPSYWYVKRGGICKTWRKHDKNIKYSIFFTSLSNNKLSCWQNIYAQCFRNDVKLHANDWTFLKLSAVEREIDNILCEISSLMTSNSMQCPIICLSSVKIS